MVPPNMREQHNPAADPQSLEGRRIQTYYDEVYHAGAVHAFEITKHYQSLSRKLGPWAGQRVLDVACGTGIWLRALAMLGAMPAGVDISKVALGVCRESLPEAVLNCARAEELPFIDQEFDFISCLGALEHFLDPAAALREMVRVAKPEARFLLLVPNSDFLPFRMGIYRGTAQSSVREELRTLQGWQELFESAGLRVIKRWRDLHVLSLSWITRGPWCGWPARLTIALMLPVWPLRWQYQVYHYCALRK
jgi:SAM-dependent methyltransferase